MHFVCIVRPPLPGFQLTVIAPLLGLLVFACVLGACGGAKRPGEIEDPVLRQARQIARDRKNNDSHIWTHEMGALRYELIVSHFVDQFRRQQDRFAVLRALPFKELRMAPSHGEQLLPFGTTSSRIGAPQEGDERVWSQGEWHAFLEGLERAGMKADYFQAGVTHFTPATPESHGDVTEIQLECHLRAPPAAEKGRDKPTYFVLRGTVLGTWEPPVPSQAPSMMSTVRIRTLEWLQRNEAPGFAMRRHISVGDPDAFETVRLTPLIVEDVDRDGLADVILGGVNKLLRNQGDFSFATEPFLVEEPSGLSGAAALADFNGDTYPDFLGFRETGEALIVDGNAEGFGSHPRLACDERLPHSGTITVGDIDNDGDLDVWVGRYLPPYEGGNLPQPYDDARDGYASKLLVNDGGGRFEDVSTASGLQIFRRVKSGSFIDLDSDRDLDLLVVSDHGGIEFFANNGRGTFTDKTTDFFDDWQILGQGHAIGHFDSDGEYDLFIAGRWSNALHRMDRMRLERSDFPDFREDATKIASGNRMFLSSLSLRETRLDPWAQNAGWMSGAAAIDFDNDADDDLFLTNGHLTGRSVREFDSQYWRHDVFLTEGIEPEVLHKYFESPELAPSLAALRSGAISWGGYQSNRLLLNRGNAFSEIAYLQGLALSKDTKGAAVADFNGDGKLDLGVIVEEAFFEAGELSSEQSLLIYENELSESGHWLAVQLVPNARGFAKHGARVRISGDFGQRERTVFTGQTGGIQASGTLHFGLAYHDHVDYLEVIWPDGRRFVRVDPPIDQMHTIEPVLDCAPIPDPSLVPIAEGEVSSTPPEELNGP